MANLLLDPDVWNEISYSPGQFPPPEWDGTKYLFIGSSLSGKFFTGADLHTGAPSEGDIVSFTAVNNSADATLLEVQRNGSTIFSQTLATSEEVMWTSPSLDADDLIDIWVGQGQALYSQDMAITPTAVAIFSPDETLTLNQGSPPVIVTPVITSDGDPVAPDSLTLNSAASHGLAQVVGDSLSYQPNSGFNGSDSFTYHATVDGSDSNIATVHLIVNPNLPCDELGRTTKAYVSGYNLARRNVARVRRMAKRCVVAQFNGALTKGRKIVSVRWETTSPWALYMSNARIASNQRETMVDVIFNFSGWGGILATATMDNGEVYNQEFEFTVLDAPLYPTADYPTSNGPYRLDATI